MSILTEEQITDRLADDSYCGLPDEKDYLDTIKNLQKRLAEETAIVTSVWKALEIHNYEQAKPFTIAEHVANLRKRIDQATIVLLGGKVVQKGV